MSRLVWLSLAAALLVTASCSAAPRQPAGTWQQAGRLLTPRDDFGLVAVGGKLWAVGGMTGARGNVLDLVESFDSELDRWSAEASMPTARSSAGVAVVGDTIFVVGGLAAGGVVSDVVEAFDTRTGRWLRRAALPARALASGGRPAWKSALSIRAPRS